MSLGTLSTQNLRRVSFNGRNNFCTSASRSLHQIYFLLTSTTSIYPPPAVCSLPHCTSSTTFLRVLDIALSPETSPLWRVSCFLWSLHLKTAAFQGQCLDSMTIKHNAGLKRPSLLMCDLAVRRRSCCPRYRQWVCTTPRLDALPQPDTCTLTFSSSILELIPPLGG